MANTVDKVLNIAEVEVGYLEKSKAAYQKDHKILYEKTKGAGKDNYTKYGKEMHDIYPAVMDFPAYWCDCFVDWLFYMAYGIANAKKLLGGDFNDYTVASAQLYKNKDAYIKRGKGTPKPGDQIFFNNGTKICHTGIVYKVDSTYVYTIEGNTSGGSTVVANGGGVAKKKYALTYAKIDGYGRPKYDVKVDVKTTYPGKFPTLPKIAVKDKNGKIIKYRTWFEQGDKGAEITKLQAFLNWYFGKVVLKCDGVFGSETAKYLAEFQKKEKLTVDKQFGEKSLTKAKTVKK